MKFLIFGCGAIGSVHGAFLSRAGHEVTLFGRRDRMVAIAEKGLEVDGIWGRFRVRAISTEYHLDRLSQQTFDVILFCVRAYDTEEAGRQAASLCGPDTLLVSMQNGLGNWEILTSILPPERVALARVIFGAKTPAPDRATVTVIADSTRLGSPLESADSGQLRQVAETIEKAGIPTEYTDKVFGYIWAKVFYNSALNPLSVLRNKTYGQLGDDPEARVLMDRVIGEAFAVARAEKAPLFWETPDQYLQVFYGREIPATRDHRSSMLQSFEKGKPTEVDALNGALVAKGDLRGIPVETNRELVRLLKEKERLARRT